MTAVADTNILVSAVLSSAGAPARIVAAWEGGRIRLVVSRATLEELEDVFSRPSMVRRFPLAPNEASRLVALIWDVGSVVTGASLTGVVAGDPRDDHVVSAAVESRADCIVTGDEHLLALGEYDGIPILSARELLERLGAGSE
jgi:uncharacterized protein